MVAAPSAVALTDSVPASNTECPAGGSTTCPDQAGVDTIAGDSGSTGAEGTDSSTDQPGGDQPTGGGQPGDGGGGNESGAGEAKGDPDAVDTGTKIDL